MKIHFSQLDKKVQLDRCIIPQHVSVTKNPDDETNEQIIKQQDKFINLPEYLKEKLSSDKTGEKIQQIGKLFNLELLQMASIARAIRSYCFGEIKLEDFPKIFSEEMGIDLNKAREISNLVIQKIINDDSQEKEYRSQLINLTLSAALKKYPELGEQLITSEKIKLQNFPDPVRPSIKNWLSCYTFNMGYDSHNTMARSEFLFQNENTRILSHQDRQKLTYILKAYDENTPVSINENLKQVAFPKAEIIEHKAQTSDTKKISDVSPSNNFKPTNKTEWQRQENNSESKDIFQIRRNETGNFFKETASTGQPITDLNSKKNVISNGYNKYEPPKSEKPLRKSFEDEDTNNLQFTPAPKNYSRQINQQLNNSLVRGFTSPQKMPFESPKQPVKTEENHGSRPLVITPGAFERNGNGNNNQNLPKNVVNLKE